MRKDSPVARTLKNNYIECSKRWAYVRDYYIRRRRKPGTGSFGEAAKKRSEQLSFLDSLSSRKRSNIEESHKKESSNDVTKHTEESEKANKHVDHDSNNAQIIFHSLKTPSAKKRKCASHGNTKSNKYAKERMKILRQKQVRSQKVQELDANDHFFASMAKIVKKLPLKKQAKIRLQIGTIVGHAEIEYLSRVNSEDYRSSSVSSGSNNETIITVE